MIDLRGNPGGAIKSMESFTGGFFDHEVKIADRVGRKQMKPSIAKPFGRAYQGNVVILLDSESGSCAEMFARVMQLEKRAIVVGDRSSGSAMEAHTITHKVGSNYFTPFALSLTDADLVMSDGKSLEHVGVTPDVVKLPTVEDLAAGRDPVLAYAAESVGGHLTPEEAGKMFPVRWPAK